MDPADPTSFNHRTEVLTNGRTYHFVDQVPDKYEHGKTPVLLLCHGFPDLWYGWRNQIGPWCKQGWRVIAVDMLGYGGTSKPHDADEYTMGKICADLALLLDALKLERVIVLGHDWGSLTAWKFCQWQPSRVQAVIGLSVALPPRKPVYVSAEKMAEKIPDFSYMLFMVDPSTPAYLEQNLPKFLDIIYRTAKTWIRGVTKRTGFPDAISAQEGTGKGDLLNDKELAYYVENFKRGGMRGPTNWYRCFEPRWKEETEANLKQELPASLPALFFHPRRDPTSPQLAVEAMKPFVPNLEIVEVEGASHWLLLECKDLVTQKVIDWVQNLLKEKTKL